MNKFIATTMIVLFSLGVSFAADAPWLPDGAEVKQAVAARRGRTELSKLAASLAPGAIAELKCTMPKDLWESPKWKGGRNAGGSGGLHIAGWTDDAHWDSRTGQFFYMGLRQTRRFIAYSESDNAWRSIELDPNSDNPCFRSQFGHIYGSNGFDYERSRFYHRYDPFVSKAENINLAGGISFFDVVTEKWTKLPPVPKESGFTDMAIEYFGALDGLVILGKSAYLFSSVRQKWENLGSSPVSGYHSLFRHNPYRNEVLMAGGNHNPNVVARITKAGKIERLKDFPGELRISIDKLIVDPASGQYLFWIHDKDKNQKMYIFDSDKNEYRINDKFAYPYSRGAMPVVTFIPEYGVIMWAEQKVFLYRHDPNGNYPLVTK